MVEKESLDREARTFAQAEIARLNTTLIGRSMLDDVRAETAIRLLSLGYKRGFLDSVKAACYKNAAPRSWIDRLLGRV